MTTESTEQRMPYAPPSAVLSVIRRYRERGLPEPVTVKNLQQIQVSEGNAPRTLQALKLLGLLNDEGYPTDTFVQLSKAKPPEYPDALAEIIRVPYRPIFTIVDPAQDDYEAIDNAFWGYPPRGQRQRMIRLFLDLCVEAGLMSKERRDAMQPSSSRQTTQRQPSARSSVKRARRAPQTGAAQQPEAAAQQRDVETTGEKPRSEADNGMPEYPAIAVLMQQLPKNAEWTSKRRRLWIQALVSAVDLSVDVVDEEDGPDRVYEGYVVPERAELE